MSLPLLALGFRGRRLALAGRLDLGRLAFHVLARLVAQDHDALRVQELDDLFGLLGREVGRQGGVQLVEGRRERIPGLLQRLLGILFRVGPAGRVVHLRPARGESER